MNQENWLARTELQIGEENIKILEKSHVLIAGLGGVGAAAAEMICRAGVGKMTIADFDKYSITNINRQLPATTITIGKIKSEVMAQRLLDINPKLNLNAKNIYLKDDKIYEILDGDYDYIVDAIDTLSPKIYFIFHAVKKKFKLVSSMGAGGKYDPALLKVSDISESYNCRLAYYIRKKLHVLGLNSGFKVVFSTEMVPKEMIKTIDNELNKKSIVGTLSYMPVVFGCFCASVVIRDLINK